MPVELVEPCNYVIVIVCVDGCRIGSDLWREKFVEGRISSATLSCEIRSYSLVRVTFTIMWMRSLGGCCGKILKTVLKGAIAPQILKYHVPGA
jgi:hypothetical protein